MLAELNVCRYPLLIVERKLVELNLLEAGLDVS